MVKFRFPDRLSHLPDDVLHHLLSFLDFEDVVRTCVLSKRWRHVWCSVPCLNFNIDHIKSHGKRHIYRTFINYALVLRNGSSQIKRLSVIFDCHPRVELDLFLCVTSKHKVQELFVCANGLYNYNEVRYSLDFQRPLCESLLVLKLDFRYKINLEAAPCFTSLKSLYLRRIKVSGDAANKLFSSDCVELESLHLEDIEITETEVVEISAPNLKNLCVVNVYDGCWGLCFFNLKTALVISAKNLLSFTYIGALLPDLDLQNAVCLENGVIRILEHTQLPSPGTLVGFYHARVLTLNIVAVKHFSPRCGGESLCSVVKFYNLSCLKVEIRCNADHVERLINLLKLSPNLESLFITIQEGKRFYFEDYSLHPRERTKVIHVGRPWKSREEYIPCLAHLMNFIQISFFDGSRISQQLIKFFLQNGKVLRKIKILHWNKERKENSSRKVLSFPNASSQVVVSFHSEYALEKLPYFDLGESDDAADMNEDD